LGGVIHALDAERICGVVGTVPFMMFVLPMRAVNRTLNWFKIRKPQTFVTSSFSHGRRYLPHVLPEAMPGRN
jgi:hypothetical protein